MKISELIKRIRLDQNYSYSEMAKRLGFSKGMVEAMEKERAPVSKNFVESFIRAFPLHKKNILKLYLEQYVPDEEKKNILISEAELSEDDLDFFLIKIYNFDTEGDGRVNVEKFEEVKVMISIDTGNKIMENGFVVKVMGNKMNPYFFENDRLAFLRVSFENWTKYDSKIILVKISGTLYIKKLYFENGSPFLYSFNDRIFPKLEITKDIKVEFLGVLFKRLEQDLSNFKI